MPRLNFRIRLPEKLGKALVRARDAVYGAAGIPAVDLEPALDALKKRDVPGFVAAIPADLRERLETLIVERWLAKVNVAELITRLPGPVWEALLGVVAGRLAKGVSGR